MSKKPLTQAQKDRKNQLAREAAARKKNKAPPVTAPSADHLTEDKNDQKMSCSMVIYDIPSDNKTYADPSATMRRIGFRVNLSCWVVPDGAVPHTFIHTLRTDYRANVDVVRFDAAEGPRLARMAVAAMKKEMEENAARAAEGLVAMEQRHLTLDAELIDNPEERAAAVKRYEARCARTLKRMNQIIEDVEVAIKNFGNTPEALGTADARKVYDTLQLGYQQKAAAFVAATNALKALNTPDATALATAAAKDLVPAPIVADMLRDHGADTAANALQAAFDRNVETADDNVFSLTAGDDQNDTAA